MIPLSKQNPNKKTKQRIFFAIIGIALISAIIGYYANNASNATNDKTSTQDIYLVSRHDPEKGFIFTIKSAGDKSIYTYKPVSEITVKKDKPISIHIINGDKDEKHDFNIDEFGVHTKDLWYFEDDTAIFTADKAGTFRYYCSLHPKMTGNFIVN